jgi:hypothetical protein
MRELVPAPPQRTTWRTDSEVLMIKSIELLFLLSAATAANAGPVPMSEISNPEAPALILAAAGGHDSVGSLIPLPLWPPYTPRVYVRAPHVSKHRGKRCSAYSCSLR